MASSSLVGNARAKRMALGPSAGTQKDKESPLAAIAPTHLVLRFLAIRDAESLSRVCTFWWRLIARYSRRKRQLRLVGTAPCRIACWSKLMRVNELEIVIENENNLEKAYVAALGRDPRPVSSFEIDGIEGEIQRDVPRTFPHHPAFSQNSMHDTLGNVLLAIARAAPKVGYCQGMNFVVGCFLTLTKAPQAFGLALALVRHMELDQLWRPGVPKLKCRIYQFQSLLAAQEPELHAHFEAIGLAPDFFASRWFLTLFSYSVGPSETLWRVWDVFFHEGWKTIFRVGIAVLRDVKRKLLTMTLEEVSKYFRAGKHVRQFASTQEKLIGCALQIKVSGRQLRRLEGAYISSALRKIAEGEPSALVIDERAAVALRNKMRALETPTKLDVRTLRARIEDVEHNMRAAKGAFERASAKLTLAEVDVDELEEFKTSTCSQLHRMMYTGGIIAECEFKFLREKIEALETEARHAKAEYRAAYIEAEEAQLDVAELVEKKRLFSDQLACILENSERAKSMTLRSLFDDILS